MFGTNSQSGKLIDNGRDPAVNYHRTWRTGPYYYYTHVDYDNRAVFVRRSRRVLGLASAKPVEVWRPPDGTPYSHEIWAPELHRLFGRWYIYVAASNGDSSTHRMYCLGGSASDPQQPFELIGKVASPDDQWAIDGTVMKHRGALYMLWSGWKSDTGMDQHIFIAPMSDPWTISGDRACISSPTFAWEISRHGVNEGPQIVRTRHGFLSLRRRIHVLFSANGAWSDDYCIAQLSFHGGDLLAPANWSKHPVPIFAQDQEQLFGPGHASFLVSRFRNRGLMLFHAAKHKGAGWERDVHYARFTWDHNGLLIFRPTVKPVTTLRV